MFKAVIIGCGRIGCEYDFDPKRVEIATHAGAYAANPSTQLLAIADLDEDKIQKAQAHWDIPKSYTDYREMLATEKPDIVSICTWEDSHFEVTMEALKHKPKAIWCEKPITKTVEEAQKLIQSCEQAGTLLQVNYMRRFSPLYKEIKAYIQAGQLGDIQKIVAHYGNGLMTNGSHLIDLAHYFTGETFTIQSASPSQAPSSYKHDPNLAVLAQSTSGAPFVLLPQDNQNFLLLEMEIFGTKGQISLRNSGFDIEFKAPQDHRYFTGYKELQTQASPFKNKMDREFMQHALTELLVSLNENRPSLSSGQDALKALEFVQNTKQFL